MRVANKSINTWILGGRVYLGLKIANELWYDTTKKKVRITKLFEIGWGQLEGRKEEFTGLYLSL